MSQIGIFTRTDDGFSGCIPTFMLDVEVTILPAEKSDAENPPDHRVFLDGHEVGAAWDRTSDKAGSYLSLTIDDPSFAEPLRCRLFQSATNKGAWALHWTRRKKHDDEG